MARFSPSNTSIPDLDVDDGTLSIDETNNRVGIGTTSPSHRLHVKSSGNSTYPLYIEANDGSNLGGLYQGGSGDGSFYVRNQDGGAKIILDSVGVSSFLGGGISVAGAAAFSGPSSTFVTFTDSDATPTVAAGNLFKTNTTGVTITMFDGGVTGQIINVISTGAIVYDVTGTNLKGGSTNITTASGDVTTWVFDGTNWYLINFMDVSANLSGGH